MKERGERFSFFLLILLLPSPFLKLVFGMFSRDYFSSIVLVVFDCEACPVDVDLLNHYNLSFFTFMYIYFQQSSFSCFSIAGFSFWLVILGIQGITDSTGKKWVFRMDDHFKRPK